MHSGGDWQRISMHSAFRTLTSNRFFGIRMSRSLGPAISKDSRRRHRLQWEYSEPHGQISVKKRRGKRDPQASKTGKSPDFHFAVTIGNRKVRKSLMPT